MRLFDEKKQRSTVSYRNRAKIVTANREMLGSVIFNFLTNAIHYADVDTNGLQYNVIGVEPYTLMHEEE